MSNEETNELLREILKELQNLRREDLRKWTEEICRTIAKYQPV